MTLAKMETKAFFTRREGAEGGTAAREDMYEPLTRKGRAGEVKVATIENYANRTERNCTLTVATLENENPSTRSNINLALIDQEPLLRRTPYGAVTFSSLNPRALGDDLPSAE